MSFSVFAQSSTYTFIVALEQGTGCWNNLMRSAFILSSRAMGHGGHAG